MQGLQTEQVYYKYKYIANKFIVKMHCKLHSYRNALKIKTKWIFSG